MEYELRWTERASADIEAIVRYVSRRDPAAATEIGLGIFNRTQQLISQPELGSMEFALAQGEWRKLVYRRWKIIYTVRESQVIVGRVWPCAMDEIDLTRQLED